MNRYSFVAFVFAAATGYYVGWGHGKDRGTFDSSPVERVVYRDSPYDSVCADMLEAAWSVEDLKPPQAGLPHKP